MPRNMTAFRCVPVIGALQFYVNFVVVVQKLFYQNGKCSKENCHHKIVLKDRQLHLLSP